MQKLFPEPSVSVDLDKLRGCSRQIRSVSGLFGMLTTMLGIISILGIWQWIETSNLAWLYLMFTPEMGLDKGAMTPFLTTHIPDFVWVVLLGFAAYATATASLGGPLLGAAVIYNLGTAVFQTMMLRWVGEFPKGTRFEDIVDIVIIQNAAVLTSLVLGALVCIFCAYSILRHGGTNDLFVARLPPRRKLYRSIWHRAEAIYQSMLLGSSVPSATSWQSLLFLLLTIAITTIFMMLTAANLLVSEYRTDLVQLSNRAVLESLPDNGVTVLQTLLDGTHTWLLAVVLFVPAALVTLVTFFLPQVVVARISAIALDASKALLRPHAMAKLKNIDGRRPVVFLRPFKDERVVIRAGSIFSLGGMFDLERRNTQLDRVLGETFAEVGPVIAVGHPKDREQALPPKRAAPNLSTDVKVLARRLFERALLRPEWRRGKQYYGAWRVYLDDDEWKAWVAKGIQRGCHSVVCVDAQLTQGVLWECGELARQGKLESALFLFHPETADIEVNRRVANALIESLNLNVVLPDHAPVVGFWLTQTNKDQDGDIVGHLVHRTVWEAWFGTQEARAVFCLSKRFDAEAYRMMGRSFIRYKTLQQNQNRGDGAAHESLSDSDLS